MRTTNLGRALAMRTAVVFLASLFLVGRAEPARPAAHEVTNVFTPIVGSILGTQDAPVPGTDGKAHLVYEVVLTNAKAVPATLDKIDVASADNGAVLKSLSGDALVASLHTLDAKLATSAAIPPNESRMLFIELEFASVAAAPKRIVHRISGSGASSPSSREPEPIAYELAPYDVARKTVPVFAAPLEGGRWLAANGCCGVTGAHRGAVQTVNGRLWDSQRFAIDWMRFDKEGRMVVGDPADVHNWVDYGATVRAAAGGTVIEMKDGLPDQVPGKLPAPGTITIETVDGNHVVIDHGNGLFTFYAHLIAGSVTVKVGDHVLARQKLGLLGNSGNTSAPHLHFHVMSGPSPLGSDGLPYVVDRFTLLQQIADADLDKALAGESIDSPTGAPAARAKELPLDRTVVDFGGR